MYILWFMRSKHTKTSNNLFFFFFSRLTSPSKTPAHPWNQLILIFHGVPVQKTTERRNAMARVKYKKKRRKKKIQENQRCARHNITIERQQSTTFVFHWLHVNKQKWFPVGFCYIPLYVCMCVIEKWCAMYISLLIVCCYVFFYYELPSPLQYYLIDWLATTIVNDNYDLHWL